MILKHCKNKYCLFKENRVLFADGPGENPSGGGDGWWDSVLNGVDDVTDIPVLKQIKGFFKGIGVATDAVNNVAKAAATISEAGGNLLNAFADLVKLGTTTLNSSIVGISNNGTKLINFLKDEWVGEPIDLPEYAIISKKYFAGTGVNSYQAAHPFKFAANGLEVPMPTIPPKVKQFMRYQRDAAMLDALIFQLKNFYDPVMHEIAKVEMIKNQRIRLEWKTREERQKLREKIDGEEKLLNSGTVLDAGVKMRLQIDKAMDEKSLKQLEAQCSLNIMWQMPQIQNSEFPPGSGNQIVRFVPGNEMVMVNLEELYGSLGAYASSFAPLIKTYTKEKIKIEYWRQKLELDKTGVLQMSAGYLKDYQQELDTRVKNAKDDATAFDQPKEPMYYLIKDSFTVRRASVQTYETVSDDFNNWKVSGKVPMKLKILGVTVAGGKIVKGNDWFIIQPNGSIWVVSDRTPADFNAQNYKDCNLFPKKMFDYGCRIEDGKIVKTVTFASGKVAKFTYKVQPDGSIIATPDTTDIKQQKLLFGDSPGAVGVWKAIN